MNFGLHWSNDNFLDRMTVKNLEIEEAKEKRREVERKKLAEERKKYTLSMIEKDAKKDFEMERDENALLGKLCALLYVT